VLPLAKTSFKVKTIDGKDYYIVEKSTADQLNCIELDDVESGLLENQALKATLREYQNVSTKLSGNVDEYRSVNTDLLSTLDRSIALTTKYDNQIKEYNRLSNEFDSLAQRYDDLAGKYRDIALNRTSFMSMDAGVGMDENGDVMGLLGVGFKNFRAWGVAQQDNNGLIIGGSLPF